MFFQLIYDKSLAQASYLIGCQVNGEAIVIDPKRDVDTYLEIAKQNNLRITKVTETHIHADFLSGSRELVALTNAEIYLSDEGGTDWQYEFPHIGLHHGDIIKLGNLTLEVIHTPGHTPESISFLLTDHPATEQPVMIMTGDFVFVGDVGRPDLLEKAAHIMGTKEKGAEQMFDSLQHFMALPDYLQIWPGHGAGSSCGKALGAVSNSTVGYEKIRNWALEIVDKRVFVEALLEGQPEPPTYFAMMKKLNKITRPLLLAVPQIPLLSQEELGVYYHSNAQIVDTRNKLDFAEAHLPKTLNIQQNNAFATWCGWMLDYDRPIVLIVDKDKVEDAVRKLMRIGMDNVVGYITKPDYSIAPKESTHTISREELKALIDDEAYQILDVRNQNEFAQGHIKGAEHVFVGTLAKKIDQIDPNKKIALYCQSGDRAAIASSFLLGKGFKDLKVYFTGMKDWLANNEEVEV